MRLAGLAFLVAVVGLVVAAMPAWWAAAKRGGVERRGDLHFQRGELEAAEQCWRQVLRAKPDDVSVRNKLAILCMQAAHFGKARALLAEGLELAPGEVSFLFN